jgi:HTH-type transcriptional regulator / antitoxin HipB
MSDLGKYVTKRSRRDPAFAADYEQGYQKFRIGVVLKGLRIRNGLTQDELARRLRTKKSVISRMENHAEDVRVSTLEKVAAVYGKKLHITIK